jgi:putative drug exporter of the RND superfamily
VIFARLGAFVFRYRWAVLVTSGALLALAVGVLVQGGSLTSGVIHGLEAEKAQEVVAAVTGRPVDTTFVVVLHADRKGAPEDGFADAASAALAPLRDDPRVAAVISPDDLPEAYAAPMIDGPGGTEMAIVTMAGDYREALAAYPAVRREIRSDRLTIACTGRVPYAHDLDRTLEHDLLRAEVVSLPLALLVLLYVFRTVAAATLPVGVGALAVVGGIAVVTALSRVTEIAQYTINVCSLIGTGIAIDYSLFIVSRYREELADGKGLREALTRAMGTAGRVVGFSGVAVATGFAGLLFFEGSYLFAMGVGGIVVVALGVAFALTFLPALLAVLGPRIHAGRLPRPRPQVARAQEGTQQPAGAPGGPAGRWHRMTLRVMRRPLLFLLPTLALMLTMGAPFLHVRLAASDVRVLPEEAEARRGYELLRVHFPDQVANRIAAAVRFPSSPMMPERIAAVRALEARMATLPSVRSVDGPTSDPTIAMGDDAIVLYAITDAPPESLEARAIVSALRADRVVADGTLLVGGATANDVDVTSYMLARAPKAIAVVVAATVVVVFLLLGSVVLPIKAVIMNFVSIAGSFGALVWFFQDGHIFVSEGRPVEPSLPIVLFCALFGLSMDYEVLMLSRMKESWEETGDNTQAVADGLEKTAGLITSAAAIMVAVFGAFALARVVLVKAVGLGMALAVAVDATLVRLLLVPATMRLFGHLNWWAPAVLVRLRRSLGIGRS